MFRLDMKKSFDYSPAFLLEFEPFKQEFIDRNNVDRQHRFECYEYVDGYKNKMLVSNTEKDELLPWYTSSWGLCMCDFICCGWINRLALILSVEEVEFSVKKELIASG